MGTIKRKKIYGSYYQMGNGQYRGQIQLGQKENGKRNIKTVYADSLSECQTKIMNLKHEYEHGMLCDLSDATIKTMGEKINKKKLKGNKLKEETYENNLEILKRLTPIYNLKIQDAKAFQLEEFLQYEIDRNLAQSTLDKDYQLLLQIFREAVKDEIITKNPMDKVEKPISSKKTRKIRGLTLEEQKRTVEVLQNTNYLHNRLLLVMVYTGMRMKEICNLTVKDINLKQNTICIHHSKTKASERTISIPEQIKNIFYKEIVTKGKILTPDALVFVGREGKKLTTNQVNCSWIRLKEKYNLIDKTVKGDVDLHSLRHTYATRNIESGTDREYIKETMGHSSIDVTIDVYSDVFEEQKKKNDNRLEEYYKSVGL